MLVFEELIDCLFLFVRMVIIIVMKMHIENISSQDLKSKIATSNLMEESFMINQLMT